MKSVYRKLAYLSLDSLYKDFGRFSEKMIETYPELLPKSKKHSRKEMNQVTTMNAIEQSLGLSGNDIYAKGIELLKKYGPGGAILDFGAGRGTFLKSLPALNFTQIVGADLMAGPGDLSDNSEWIQQDLNETLPKIAEQFDVIVSLEVIEHLENPRKTVREWKRLLKSHGRLIISTPNNGSIRSLLALILKGHFVSFLDKDYPAHITALTKMDLKRILTENGFTEINFHFTNKGLIPGLNGLTWQRISMGMLRGEKFSDNIFVTAIRP